ncbi:hypothetical protein, partial [Gramella echinicola]|uniref:Ig-like domain-containing protein n=1 Tax=Christiangramia echinicola TaxID=279359 RepID=UPI00047CE9E9
MKLFLPETGKKLGLLCLNVFLFLSISLSFAQTETINETELVSDEGITVNTDKDDYAPLSNAVFSGSGFEPFELVELRVKNLTQPCNTTHTDQSYAPWSVTTDENGSFVTNWTVCNCPGDSLRLKVTGQATGKIGYAYFTDSKPNSVSLTPSTQIVEQGNSTTYDVEVELNGNNNSCNVTLSVSGLPAGTTAAFSGGSNPYIYPGGNGSYTRMLTITTSGSTPIGSDDFTVTASGCGGVGNQSGTASITGTVNVTATCTSPAAPISGGDQTECSSTPVQTLTATATPPAGATVVWFENSSGGTSVSPTLSQIGSKTYYAESQNSSACVSNSRTPVTLIINETPTASLSPNNVNICQGESTTLSIVLTGSGTISGTLTGGVPFNGAAGTTIEVVVSPASTTTYSITSLTNGTCSGTGMGSTDVNILGKYTADAGTDQTICPAATASISGSVTGSPSTTLWTTSGTGIFDDAGALSTTYNPSPSDVIAGSVTLTLTASGTGACDGSDGLVLTLQDVTAPVVTTQDITVQLDTTGSATITTAQIDNGSTDNCTIDTYELDITSFECSNVGANTVELTVTDVNGNSDSATATVTVVDNIAPVVTTQDITVYLDA